MRTAGWQILAGGDCCFLDLALQSLRFFGELAVGCGQQIRINTAVFFDRPDCLGG